MSSPQVTPTLAQSIRAKFPGQYDDMDDVTLEGKVLAKYPQYSDMPRTQPQTSPTPQGTISNQPAGVLPWLRNLEGDVRYGTKTTLPGQLLAGLGANGVGDTGAAQTVASPVLGPIKMAQGYAEAHEHPMQGVKDLVGGALQTATLPGAFVAPEAAEAAISKIPSQKYAGTLFQQVMSKAKNVPLPMTDELSGALSRYQQLVDNGGQQSLAVRKLLQRFTDPDKAPLTYQDARDFYSNISRLSADEFNRLTPVMKQQIGAVRVALNNALSQTAGSVGQAGSYLDAMHNFRQSKQLQSVGQNVGSWVTQQLLDKLPWLAAAYAGKKLMTPNQRP